MVINAWRRLLAHLKRGTHSRTPTLWRRKTRPLLLEQLEERVTPATVSWINPLGGSWSDPSNWSTAAVPAAGDDVVIDLPSNVTVHLSGGSASVNSLQLNDTLVLDGGPLTTAGALVNSGAVHLAATDANNDPALVVNGTLTNTSTGLLSADQGAGGVRYVTANIDNQGSVNVDAGVGLLVQGPRPAGPTVTLEGGSFAAGSGGWLVQIGGAIHYTGGTISGEYTTLNTELDVAATAPAGATINVRGQNKILDENASPTVTLWVQGSSYNGDGVLTAAAGAVNAGVIDLASASTYWGETLAAPDGLVNLAGGRVAVYGGGGPPALTGTVTNDGYLSLSGVGAMSIDALVNHGTVGVDATGTSPAPGLASLSDAAAAEAEGGGGTDASADGASAAAAPDGIVLYLTRLTVGAWTNDGTVAVDPGTQLEVAPDGSGRDTFTQAGGLVAADGQMIVDGGVFHFTGGGLMGDFSVRNGWIQVDATVTQPSTIDVAGHGNVLLDNASTVVTLRVQGGSPLGDGDAYLNAADGSTNHGVVVLESLDGVYHGYFRVPAGTFTNDPGGAVLVSLPAGDAGAGSITAGVLVGAGGAVADATGLPVLDGLASAQADVEAAGGDLSAVDAGTAMDAVMAGVQGVADGVIAVAGLGGSYLAGTGLADAQALGAFDNFGQVSIALGTGTGPALAAGLGTGFLAGTTSELAAATGLSLWDGMAANVIANAGSGASSGGGGPSASDVAQGMADAVAQAAQTMVGNLTVPVAFGQAVVNVVLDAGATMGDVVLAAAGEIALLSNAAAGTPTYDPPFLSSLFQGMEQANAQGHFWSFVGNAAFNVATLGLPAAAGAGAAAFQQLKDTGNAVPLASWVGATGTNAWFAANLLSGGVQFGASLASAADGAFLGAEGLGPDAPGMGAAGAILDFMGGESGAVNLNVLLGGEDGAPTDPAVELPASGGAAGHGRGFRGRGGGPTGGGRGGRTGRRPSAGCGERGCCASGTGRGDRCRGGGYNSGGGGATAAGGRSGPAGHAPGELRPGRVRPEHGGL